MLKSDIYRCVGAVVRQSDGLILGSFCCTAPDYALTVAHVLEDIQSPEAIALHLDNRTIMVEQFTIDRRRGFASMVARLPYALSPALNVTLPVTSTVYVAGWPQLLLSDQHSGLRLLKTSIIRTRDDSNCRTFEVQGVFPKGFSGAAVVDQKGRLSGLLDELCVFEVGPHLNFSYALARKF